MWWALYYNNYLSFNCRLSLNLISEGCSTQFLDTYCAASHLIILVCCIPSLKPWSLILPTLDLHCKNSSVFCTPNLLNRHTKMEVGVSIEQIWCAGHTTVITVYPLNPIDLIILVCCIPSLKPWSLILPTLDLPP